MWILAYPYPQHCVEASKNWYPQMLTSNARVTNVYLTIGLLNLDMAGAVKIEYIKSGRNRSASNQDRQVTPGFYIAI
jgi:hypothetical protein